MVKHTPGPWFVDAEWDVMAADGLLIAQVIAADKDGEDWEIGPVSSANARLIAAAPELLHCLKVVCEHAEGLGVDARLHLDEVRSVIAKAEGKE